MPKLKLGILAAYSMYLKGKLPVWSLIRKRAGHYLEFLMRLGETRSDIHKILGLIFSNHCVKCLGKDNQGRIQGRTAGYGMAASP